MPSRLGWMNRRIVGANTLFNGFRRSTRHSLVGTWNCFDRTFCHKKSGGTLLLYRRVRDALRWESME